MNEDKHELLLWAENKLITDSYSSMFLMVRIFNLCLLLSLALVNSFCYGFTLSPSINYQAQEEIELKEGSEYKFIFNIEKSCTQEVGILFSSLHGGANNSKEIFGRFPYLNLPVKFDIQIVNSGSNIVFERNNFGGQKIGTRYGPNPIMFIAGTPYLHKGDYLAKISVNKIEEKITGMKADFFVSVPPKIQCK